LVRSAGSGWFYGGLHRRCNNTHVSVGPGSLRQPRRRWTTSATPRGCSDVHLTGTRQAPQPRRAPACWLQLRSSALLCRHRSPLYNVQPALGVSAAHAQMEVTEGGAAAAAAQQLIERCNAVPQLLCHLLKHSSVATASSPGTVRGSRWPNATGHEHDHCPSSQHRDLQSARRMHVRTGQNHQ
jgi:hypothetical protein